MVGTCCHMSADQNKKFPAVHSRTIRHIATWYVVVGSSRTLHPGLIPKPGRINWNRGLRFSFIFRFKALPWIYNRNFTNTAFVLRGQLLLYRDIIIISSENYTHPSIHLSIYPSTHPPTQPSIHPSIRPHTNQPTNQPTKKPTNRPTNQPTNQIIIQPNN